VQLGLFGQIVTCPRTTVARITVLRMLRRQRLLEVLVDMVSEPA
jgi:hypothetical protein